MIISSKIDRNLPLHFDEQEWRKFIEASCYSYAINLHINQCLLVGELIGKRCNVETSDENLIKVLKEEVQAIGYSIKQIEKDEIIKDNEFKICLERNYTTGWYHFFRQEDGFWSHKYPLEPPRRGEITADSEDKKSWYFKIRIG